MTSRRAARHAALTVVLFLALVVAALPGTTSAAAPALPPPLVVAPDGPRPILIQIDLSFLLARAPRLAGPEPVGQMAGPEPVEAVPPRSYFQDALVVSFYGHPGVAVMGELGAHEDIDDAVAELRALAAEYDALNGDQDVIPALHLIVDVAQRDPMPDGLYLERMPPEVIEPYVAAAREHGLLLFLDLQIGWSTPLTDVQRLERFLEEPFVHLALDPEFATRSYGAAPGVVIGTLGAADVNEVQGYLADLVREHGLPPKVLVLHQFRPEMLADTADFDDVPEVEVSVDMDGYGAPWPKLEGYERYALAEYSERPAIKLFYRWDEPLIQPDDLMALDRPPDYIVYQ
ncbi:MAG: hypothetical protein GEU80_09535 [Dehalococcoidia bacterium]|nr:hypothetical protein [Dehalococcoidia bacterium]